MEFKCQVVEEFLSGVKKSRRFIKTTDSKRPYPVCPDLINDLKVKALHYSNVTV